MRGGSSALWLCLFAAALAAQEADSGAVRTDPIIPDRLEPRGLSRRAFTDALSYVSDEYYGPDRAGVPGVRPKPLLEIGDPFQGQGPLTPGFQLPWGAFWNPSLLIYGTARSAFQTFDSGADGRADRTEWVNRLDVFANLRLSATERILFGMRPFDNPDRAGPLTGGFTGYEFEPDRGRAGGWKERFDGTVSTLFFEGDFGELFPGLDLDDDALLDLGFTIGRQPLLFQNGVMLNGTLDAVGLVRNSLRWLGASNIRIAGLYANPEWFDPEGEERLDLVGLFNEIDVFFSSIEVDVMYRNSRETSSSALYFGVAATQRLGHFNTAFRYNLAVGLGEGRAEIPNGHVITVELSMDVPGTSDVLYLNGFAGIDEYTSAFRSPDAGGPLGRIGILFASPGIGRYAAPLDPTPKRAVGGAFGYQMFFNEKRTQLILEAAGRASTADGTTDDEIGFGARVQQAFLQHFIVLAEGYASKQESFDVGYGGRLELIVKF